MIGKKRDEIENEGNIKRSRSPYNDGNILDSGKWIHHLKENKKEDGCVLHFGRLVMHKQQTWWSGIRMHTKYIDMGLHFIEEIFLS